MKFERRNQTVFKLTETSTDRNTNSNTAMT